MWATPAGDARRGPLNLLPFSASSAVKLLVPSGGGDEDAAREAGVIREEHGDAVGGQERSAVEREDGDARPAAGPGAADDIVAPVLVGIAAADADAAREALRQRE